LKVEELLLDLDGMKKKLNGPKLEAEEKLKN